MTTPTHARDWATDTGCVCGAVMSSPTALDRHLRATEEAREHRPVTKAHLARTRADLVRTSAARASFGAIIVEYVAGAGWDVPVPSDYRQTWDRLDVEYRLAKTAYDLARHEASA